MKGTVICPNCGKGVNALPNMKKLKCKSCGVPFELPKSEPAPVEVPVVALPVPEPIKEIEIDEEPERPQFDTW